MADLAGDDRLRISVGMSSSVFGSGKLYADKRCIRSIELEVEKQYHQIVVTLAMAIIPSN